jgi:hypothetical protein
MKYRVYDDRTNETLFESYDRLDCVLFIEFNFDEGDGDWEHIWIGEKEVSS